MPVFYCAVLSYTQIKLEEPVSLNQDLTTNCKLILGRVIEANAEIPSNLNLEILHLFRSKRTLEPVFVIY